MYPPNRPLYPTRKRKKWPYLLAALFLMVGYCAWALARPLPPLQPENLSKQIYINPAGSKLNWPAAGQAAVGIMGTDIVEIKGEQKPVPIASVAKVITALTVLQEKPLSIGQPGPSITLTQADVDLYNHYYAQDGSLLPVAAGEKINEYQMIQALMLPSANNIADTMATWAYGSINNYVTEANKYLKENGLNNTKVGNDASGMSPATVSTAADLVKLGNLAMKNHVLAEIVNQPTASGLPVANTVRNVNSLLGTNNIIGIKTGNTDQAGGVFLSASRINVNQKPVTIITAVTQQPDLFTALKISNALIKSAQANFGPVQPVTEGDLVGRYKVPWGSTVDVVASGTINTVDWKGRGTQVNLKAVPVPYNKEIAGTLTLPASDLTKEQTVPVKLKSLPAPPSAWWRLTHPLN